MNSVSVGSSGGRTGGRKSDMRSEFIWPDFVIPNPAPSEPGWLPPKAEVLCRLVGWVERSEPHRYCQSRLMGILGLIMLPADGWTRGLRRAYALFRPRCA